MHSHVLLALLLCASMAAALSVPPHEEEMRRERDSGPRQPETEMGTYGMVGKRDAADVDSARTKRWFGYGGWGGYGLGYGLGYGGFGYPYYGGYWKKRDAEDRHMAKRSIDEPETDKRDIHEDNTRREATTDDTTTRDKRWWGGYGLGGYGLGLGYGLGYGGFGYPYYGGFYGKRDAADVEHGPINERYITDHRKIGSQDTMVVRTKREAEHDNAERDTEPMDMNMHTDELKPTDDGARTKRWFGWGGYGLGYGLGYGGFGYPYYGGYWKRDAEDQDSSSNSDHSVTEDDIPVSDSTKRDDEHHMTKRSAIDEPETTDKREATSESTTRNKRWFGYGGWGGYGLGGYGLGYGLGYGGFGYPYYGGFYGKRDATRNKRSTEDINIDMHNPDVAEKIKRDEPTTRNKRWWGGYGLGGYGLGYGLGYGGYGGFGYPYYGGFYGKRDAEKERRWVAAGGGYNNRWVAVGGGYRGGYRYGR